MFAFLLCSDEGRRIKKTRRCQNVIKTVCLRNRIIAFPWLDFIRRVWKVVDFSDEHVFHPPAVTHRARCSLRHCELTPAPDHQIQNAQMEGLLKQIGKTRLLFNNDQCRLFAIKTHAIGRKTQWEITTIFTPDTILRLHRNLIARRFDFSEKRKPGRPRIRPVIVDANVRDARENPKGLIRSALQNPNYHAADSTPGNLLTAHGVKPAPDRQQMPGWSTFLIAYGNSIFAADFRLSKCGREGEF